MSVSVGMALNEIVGASSQIVSNMGGPASVLIEDGLSSKFGRNALGISAPVSQTSIAPSPDMKLGM